GCKLNSAETSTYERGFLEGGWEVVGWNDQADVYVVNTCAVTETAEKKSRNLIRRAHKTAPQAHIVVTGCYAELRREQLLALEGVWKVYGAADKGRMVPEILSTSTSPAVSDTLPAYSSGERTRSFLKVQDGCDNFCAYCTVPFARGRSRSLSIAQVLSQAREIAAKDIKEIVLTGVNTGDFGRKNGESFLDLLKALNEVDGIERYRISSIEPNLISPEIVDWIASGTKFQPHFHIPLQSGSDSLLKRVGRRYDTALFASRIDYIRKAMESEGSLKVFFGIDVIAGLPGESDELFLETYNFLKERIRPAYIHVFPYSRRPGTLAASWKDQVRDSVKTQRVALLEDLCRQLHEEFVEANRGLKAQVLWESSQKNGLMGGYTGNYIRVERPFDKLKINTVEDITI
ncbi:MAG: tRNA (N(6)-L-threonylcarbamoyladenosine(37)-C(2))-methylthiotransferase MtaB, partial [Bacteroidales bacterium]|nr:tRNA (N(6)-L-threonylcarbamoyladenosine(37)-C(2))-methylthiotransferase MtaB [Bacteroidales bacterium]